MNCLESLELLQERLDGPFRVRKAEADRSEALELHLSECASCRERHSAAQWLQESDAFNQAPEVPVDFARNVAAVFMRDRRLRREKLRRRLFITMALAASVLLTLLGAYWFSPGDRTDDGKTQFVEHQPKPVEAKKPEPKNALVALTDRVADTTREHAKVVWVAANLDAVDRLSAVNEIPMLNPSVRETGQEVSDGVRTVTRGARRAFDFFAREIPMPDVGEIKDN